MVTLYRVGQSTTSMILGNLVLKVAQHPAGIKQPTATSTIVNQRFSTKQPSSTLILVINRLHTHPKRLKVIQRCCNYINQAVPGILWGRSCFEDLDRVFAFSHSWTITSKLCNCSKIGQRQTHHLFEPLWILSWGRIFSFTPLASTEAARQWNKMADWDEKSTNVTMWNSQYPNWSQLPPVTCSADKDSLDWDHGSRNTCWNDFLFGVWGTRLQKNWEMGWVSRHSEFCWSFPLLCGPLALKLLCSPAEIPCYPIATSFHFLFVILVILILQFWLVTCERGAKFRCKAVRTQGITVSKNL